MLQVSSSRFDTKLHDAPVSSKNCKFSTLAIFPNNATKHALLLGFTLLPDAKKLPSVSFFTWKLVGKVHVQRWLASRAASSNRVSSVPFSHSDGTPRQPC